MCMAMRKIHYDIVFAIPIGFEIVNGGKSSITHSNDTATTTTTIAPLIWLSTEIILALNAMYGVLHVWEQCYKNKDSFTIGGNKIMVINSMLLLVPADLTRSLCTSGLLHMCYSLARFFTPSSSRSLLSFFCVLFSCVY